MCSGDSPCPALALGLEWGEHPGWGDSGRVRGHGRFGSSGVQGSQEGPQTGEALAAEPGRASAS